MKKIEKLVKTLKGGVGLSGKDAFHSAAKAGLKEFAKDVLRLQEFDVRSNKGGYGVVGEVILHTPFFYLQLCPEATIGNGFFIRTCKGMKDYTGGRNIWPSAEEFLNGKLVKLIQSMRPNEVSSFR